MIDKRANRITIKDGSKFELRFLDGTVKEYDVSILFDRFPVFEKLKDRSLFEQAHLDIPTAAYGIIWNDEIDLSVEEVWCNGKTIRKETITDEKIMLANAIIEARNKLQISQLELSKRAHIYQPDLSDIERGLKNPSLATIKKIADGLGMNLEISFTTPFTYVDAQASTANASYKVSENIEK